MSAPGRTPQLRRYQLTAGTMEELVRWWRDDLVPVRKSLGCGIRFGRVILATDAMRRKPKPTDGSRPTCWRRGSPPRCCPTSRRRPDIRPQGRRRQVRRIAREVEPASRAGPGDDLTLAAPAGPETPRHDVRGRRTSLSAEMAADVVRYPDPGHPSEIRTTARGVSGCGTASKPRTAGAAAYRTADFLTGGFR